MKVVSEMPLTFFWFNTLGTTLFANIISLQVQNHINYKFVRFEDIASQPLDYAQDLYKFYGVPIHDKVLNFIKSSTKDSSQSDTEHLQSAYSTKRNSQTVLTKWRHNIPWEVCKQIEIHCRRTMEPIGYKLAGSAMRLRNDSISLLDKISWFIWRSVIKSDESK